MRLREGRMVSSPETVLVALLLGMAPFIPAWGQVGPIVINEIMADNASVLQDDAGNYPDWVELFNTSTTTVVDLGGWKLTDKAGTNKFTIPPSTLIYPRGRLLIYCDGETNLPGVHTPFKLGANGSYFGITNNLPLPNNRGDAITYGLQVTDYSVGRVPDGTGLFQLNRATPEAANLAQPLGLTNLLRINEWAATNMPTQVTNSKDWLELYNPSTNPVSLGGLVFTTELTVPATNNKPIAPLSFIDAGGFIRFWCLGNKLANDNDELDFKLSHQTGETNTLYWTNKTTIIDRIGFAGNNAAPGYWSVDVSYGRLPDGDSNIVKFAANRTTPGKSNFQPITHLAISEVLTHTDPPLEDAVEICNLTATNVNIGRWWLSNDRNDRKKWRIPPNTILPAFGFKVFYEYIGGTVSQGFNWDGTGTNRCFTFNSANGDHVVLTAVSPLNSNDLTGFELVEDFGPVHNGMSLGRYVTSTTNKEFVYMSARSFGMDNPVSVAQFRTGVGATNPYPFVGPLVFSEIMYHPPDIIYGTNHIDDSTNEFIEILNITSTNVPLYDPAPYGTYYEPAYPQEGIYADGRTNTWRLRGAVDFDFPTNVVLAPGQYLLLVNFAPTNTAMSNAFCRKYSVPAGVRLFGPYSGKLSNKDASFELRAPDTPQKPGRPDYPLVPFPTMEKVHYYDGSTNGPAWPTNADGRGFSLHRVTATGYGSDPTNWVDSVPSPGGPGRDPSLELVESSTAGAFRFGFMAKANWSYTVQYKSLAGSSGAWVNLQSYNARATNYWCEIPDQPVNAASARYYRVITPRR